MVDLFFEIAIEFKLLYIDDTAIFIFIYLFHKPFTIYLKKFL